MSPPIDAAQHTTAPINIAAAAPLTEPAPNKVSSKSEENKIVAIVTPDIGLFDEPTTPAIYDATAENKKPKIIITIDIKTAIQIDSSIPRYNRNTGINIATNA